MTSIEPTEAEIVGRWIFDGRQNQADEACRRIEWLTNSVLHEVASSKESGGWDTLFRDPSDGRLWERTYPQSEMHGGGPPRLAAVAEFEARQRYDF